MGLACTGLSPRWTRRALGENCHLLLASESINGQAEAGSTMSSGQLNGWGAVHAPIPRVPPRATPSGCCAGSGPAAISGDTPGAGSGALLLLLSCDAGTAESLAQSPERPPEEGGPSLLSQGMWGGVDACGGWRAVGEGLGRRRASSCLPPATEGGVARERLAPVRTVLPA